MNYPVWELSTFGGGFLIALIAIVHVLVAHFAVGGGLFLISLERKAYREENPALLEYVKKMVKWFWKAVKLTQIVVFSCVGV